MPRPNLEGIQGHRAKRRLQTEPSRHLPKSQTRNAIDYTLKLWNKLLVYTEHAQVKLDNNLVENAIRSTAIGKKNCLLILSTNPCYSLHAIGNLPQI